MALQSVSQSCGHKPRTNCTENRSAFTLKFDVADGEDLVDEEDFGFEMGGDGEGQADVHAGGVVLDGSVNEFFGFSEGHDFVELTAISALDMPRMAPGRKVFSRPVSSGWKPVPTSRSEPTRPWISAQPAVGRVMRESMLILRSSALRARREAEF